MLRTSLGLLVATLASACGVDENGDFEFCFHPGCDNVDDEPTSPPPAPHPIQFQFERGSIGFTPEPRLAADGVLQLDVRTRSDEVPQLTKTGDGFDFSIVGTMPRLVQLEVLGTGAGSGTIEAAISTTTPATFALSTADVGSIGASTEFGVISDRHVVMADIARLDLHVVAADGGSDLIDHSLAIDATSDPGFTQIRWDRVLLPDTPGERVLALSRRAADVTHISVRTVDRVDSIVADSFPEGASFGTLCVHGELDGERVKTYAYTFRSNDKVVLADFGGSECAGYYSAEPGATITVELAGSTAEFVVVPN